MTRLLLLTAGLAAGICAVAWLAWALAKLAESGAGLLSRVKRDIERMKP